MCTKTAKKKIHNFNRYAISCLSMAGFFWDGFQAADGLFISATMLWVWQPEFDRIDAKLLDLFS